MPNAGDCQLILQNAMNVMLNCQCLLEQQLSATRLTLVMPKFDSKNSKEKQNKTIRHVTLVTRSRQSSDLHDCYVILAFSQETGKNIPTQTHFYKWQHIGKSFGIYCRLYCKGFSLYCLVFLPFFRTLFLSSAFLLSTPFISLFDSFKQKIPKISYICLFERGILEPIKVKGFILL